MNESPNGADFVSMSDLQSLLAARAANGRMT